MCIHSATRQNYSFPIYVYIYIHIVIWHWKQQDDINYNDPFTSNLRVYITINFTISVITFTLFFVYNIHTYIYITYINNTCSKYFDFSYYYTYHTLFQCQYRYMQLRSESKMKNFKYFYRILYLLRNSIYTSISIP